MLKFLWILLILISVASAQTKSTAPAHPATSKPEKTEPKDSSEAVVTLAGFCPDSTVKDEKSPECKTVITRAQFEKLVNTVNPNMPMNNRQALAADYSRMLVLDYYARQRGLENAEHYKAMLGFVKMQVLAQELLHDIQQKAKPSAADVQKYYDDNKQKYQVMSLKRLFVPRNRPDAKAEDKAPTDQELQAKAEKYHAELAEGADFDKVQKEVYEAMGFKTPPPPTSIPEWRRDAVPANQIPLFDMKAGELSKVMIEPAGAYIYKIDTKKELPLDSVKPEIEANLANTNMKKEMETLTSKIKPEVNQAYFKGNGSQLGGPGPANLLPPSK